MSGSAGSFCTVCRKVQTIGHSNRANRVSRRGTGPILFRILLLQSADRLSGVPTLDDPEFIAFSLARELASTELLLLSTCSSSSSVERSSPIVAA